MFKYSQAILLSSIVLLSACKLDISSDGDDDMDDDSGGDPIVTLPSEVMGVEANMQFTHANAGAPYNLDQLADFTFSSSGTLFIDTNPEADDGDELQLDKVEMIGSEYVWMDETNGFNYAVSLTGSGIHEINVSGSAGSFLGQFTHYVEPGSDIPNADLVVKYAGSYNVTASSGTHSRGTVSIGTDLTIDFDTDVAFTEDDIQNISDRTFIQDEPRVQLSYGADDDADVINLYLNADLTAVIQIQYRNRNQSIDVRADVQ
ncbi:hypothetical protein DS2_08043 [Catenovulum agarivorans DS-2]|uniref:Lipoprotein n=1 Tax=Catenovulum agarivorans DS-2 TaxID=1328313 RepID=W7QRB2_9ALTE|nr:hypothetical protein [Catenovulum agarivorans]EWH10408.1 hypothetical protein DS2_08043 [Catenovulum agarivorans DS-2]